MLFQDFPHGARSDGDPKAREFALNAAVAPRFVVLGQADNKPADLGVCWWPTAAPRIRPPPGNELSVPGEDRLGAHEKRRPAVARKDAAGCGEQGAVVHPKVWPAHVPSQHVQLVAEYKDLDLLSPVGAQGKQDELKGRVAEPSRGTTR
ncbi:MAG: hypothetical protein M3526_00210 [Actinomycetota bacterium]|nr:hypothetical protein [Actinomycetota bacterium]